jgi:hypothetical protein
MSVFRRAASRKMSFYSWSDYSENPPRSEMHDGQGRVIATVVAGPDGQWHWKRVFATGPNASGVCATLREAKQRVLSCVERDQQE